MKVFGLIGYPLEHAYSPKYFAEKFKKLGITDAKYELIPLSDISKINNIVQTRKNLVGFNVTTPYKEVIIPYLQELDEIIYKLGTVNTVKITRNGTNFSLKGYNTDIFGLEKTFKLLDLPKNTKALILGSGGSGKTCAYVLNQMGIDYTHVSRNPKSLKILSYDKLTEGIIHQHNLIINASPVGMYPKVNNYPQIPYDYITRNHICFDLVYNPEETIFLKKAKHKGAKTINGFTMLYEQADKAWEIWNN